MLFAATALLAQPVSVTTACGPREAASAVCEAVFELTGKETIARASETFVVRPAKITFIILIAFVTTRLLRRLIRRFVGSLMAPRVEKGISSFRDKAPGVLLTTSQTPTLRAGLRAETIGALLRSTTTFVVWLVAAFMILGELGLDLAPLIAGAGIVGVAVGFGAQNLVRDFLSGIFMLIEDQFGVGDIIDAGPAAGTVEGVSLRSTRLRDIEGNVWHIPNGTIERVSNKSQEWSRALLDVPVSYATDTGYAVSVIKEVSDAMWRDPDWTGSILAEPEVWGVETLGSDGMAIRLVVKTSPAAQWKVSRELRARIKSAFDESGIEIPFPQRVIWHREEERSAEPSARR